MELDLEEIKADPESVAARIDAMAERIAGDDLDAEKGFSAMIQQIASLRRLVLATAVKNLNAKRKWWDRVNKCWQIEDDANAQMKAVVWIGSYSDGLPAQTILTASMTPDSNEKRAAFREAAMDSPAVRESLRDMLAEMDKRALPT